MKIRELFKKADKRPAQSGGSAPFPGAASLSGIKGAFGGSWDFETRDIRVGGGDVTATVCFIDGLVSADAVAYGVVRPLTDEKRLGAADGPEEAAALMMSGLVYCASAKLRRTQSEAVADILNGFCAVVFGESGIAVTFETRSTEKRSISEPKEEKVVKGAKDVFIELIKTNTMLIRRRLRDSRLRTRSVTVGRTSMTQAVIVYIDGLTAPALVDELERRLRSTDIDGVLTAGDIEEHISDRPRSPFPQLLRTERPDRFCLNLLEGRAGLLVDGLPIGYLAPGTLAQFMKVPEDDSNHFLVASALTVLRYLALIIALILPAFYIAVAMYHQEMLPTKLMQSIIASKEDVPFPTAVETLGMLLSFELLQEAGLRLPNPVGETVSIIGALIVGQSAVEAKVISPAIVIVVAVAGVAGYVIPNQDLSAALRLCRTALVLLAIFWGMFGIAVGCVLLIYRLCSMESFGVPYMSPFSGGGIKAVARSVLRPPLSMTGRRYDELDPRSGGEKR